jgi:heme-degrading monooxygenase HmoA
MENSAIVVDEQHRRFASVVFLAVFLHFYTNPSRNVLISDQANTPLVVNVAFARMLSTKFKPGKREEAIKIIDDSPKEEVEGFKGILALLPVDDPNSATIISIWDSEDTLIASQEGIFQEIMKATEDLRDGPPDVKNAKVRDMRAQLISIPA